MVEKICIGCNKLINENEKRVLLQTIENNSVIANEHFHFECWKNFHKKKVGEFVNKAKEKAINVMGDLTNTMNNLMKEANDLGKRAGEGTLE